MNYLAHLFLAEGREGWSVGAVLGDYVKGAVPAEMPDELQFGVRLHRRIDSLADLNPAFLNDRELFSPPVRRFVGLYLDMAHDHFLFANWDRYASPHLGSVDDFIASQYRLLKTTAFEEAKPIKPLVRRMTRLDMLGGYNKWSAITRALNGIAKHRLRQPNRMAEGIPELTAHRDALEATFHDAFPGIMAAVAAFKETG